MRQAQALLHCAAAAAECDTPVKAGLTQALGVFIDTIVICSCTAMIMLTAPENIVAGKEGMDLLQSAMRYHLGDFGVIFICSHIVFIQLFHLPFGILFLMQGVMLRTCLGIIGIFTDHVQGAGSCYAVCRRYRGIHICLGSRRCRNRPYDYIQYRYSLSDGWTGNKGAASL